MSSKDAETRQHLLLLFERPLEPISVPKGPRKQVFDLPQDSPETDKLFHSLPDVPNRRTSGTQIPLKKINIPDLSLPMALGRRDNFSLFIPYHRKMASALIHAFRNQPTLDDFLSLSAYARKIINPFLFIYAYSVAILHREDTKTLRLPSFAEILPEKYLDSTLISGARQEAINVKDASKRKPAEIPRDYTASDLDEEHRLAYFREDLGINLHHWHWHLVYPDVGDRDIVEKDRRGELFYYMHQQILARYDCERFSNNLGRTKRLLNWRDPIPEGYFPKLDSLIASRVWPPRTSNTILSDVSREAYKLKFDIQDMERWRDRLYHAIHTSSVITADGRTQQLDEENGIDILGNIMESCMLSVNPIFYGDLHNKGHMIIAFSHDPDFSHREEFGVMGDTTTAMRDPVFYRWHAFVDDIFQEHKNLLTPYRVDQLNYKEIRVTSAQIKVQGHPDNQLLTLWQKSDIDLANGLDFQSGGNVFVRVTHLQHIPFSYRITVENKDNNIIPKLDDDQLLPQIDMEKVTMGTCRIFLAPKFDESGSPMWFRDQKRLFIEMDKFTVKLKPGPNVIERKSKESSVTIPFERTFPNKGAGSQTEGTPVDDNFCGCGWPEHMLVPRGTPAGLPCQLFVMISNYEDDSVEITNTGGKMCTDIASSYCGLRDNKYPDKRAMGYPFDRFPREGIETLQEFLTPNMVVVNVTIKHLMDTVITPEQPGVNKAEDAFNLI